VGKKYTEGNRPLGKTEFGCEDNIKMDF